MGKRKRRVHRPPIAPLSGPDAIPCSSGLNLLSTEKPLNHIISRIEQPPSSAEDIMGSHEQHNAPFSISHHHHHHHNNPGRSMYLKRSRNRGHHYPRHSQGYRYSTYHGNNYSSLDHHIPFKVGNNNRWNSELGYNTEGRERAFFKHERIPSSDTAMEVIPWDDEKMVCGTCQRLLRQKHPLGSGLLTREPSVVAVLVCGHFFHADCLEQRTRPEEAGDPPCPLCLELSSQTEAPLGIQGDV